MSYIAKYYHEIRELVDREMPIAKACRQIKEEHNLLRSVESMRKAYTAYHQKQLEFEEISEVKSISLDKHGNVNSQRLSKSQQKDDIDKDEFEPVAFTTNPFGEGKWIRYDKILKFSPKELKAELDKRKPNKFKARRYRRNRRGKGVFSLGDFHLGAYVGDLLKTPDFNFDIVCDMLQKVAQIINSHKYEKVYLFLIGDFIESFSGLNHINSWKGLHKGAYAMKAVVLAHEILCEHFYSKIHNLHYAGFVSGNHDRISADAKEDQQGQVAMMMHYLFAKDYPKINSEWNPILIYKIIDAIGYLVTHGHLGISNKEISKVLFDYADNKIYNVYIKGHKHTRETKKTFKRKLVEYEDMDYVTLDEKDYRAVTCPPLFTGNFFSESLGYSSTAGFIHLYNNGNNRVTFIDYSL